MPNPKPDALGWWCQSCRSVGMVHCSEVEGCIEAGHMIELPYSERKSRHDTLRARKEPTS